MDTPHNATTRVLDILELLADHSGGMTLTELSKSMNAPKSSIFPIAHTMEDREFLFRNPETGKYFIGQQTYLIGGTYENRAVVINYVRSQMDRISEICGEVCNLGILDRGRVSYIYVSVPEKHSQNALNHTAGMCFPAYCSAMGKALLFNYSLEELRHLYPGPLERYTPNTVGSIDILYAQLLLYRKEGFAYETAEARDAVFCIAIPLCNGPRIVAALSVSMPLSQMTDERVGLIKCCFLETKPLIDSYFQLFKLEEGHDLLG